MGLAHTGVAFHTNGRWWLLRWLGVAAACLNALLIASPLAPLSYSATCALLALLTCVPPPLTAQPPPPDQPPLQMQKTGARAKLY